MTIDLSKPEELKRLINRIAGDLQEAHGLKRLLSELSGSLDDSDPLFNSFPTYWTLCSLGLRDAYLLRLCRIFDQEKNSLSLRTLLLTIRDNFWMFEQAEFEERLKDNKFVKSLASIARVPTEKAISDDLDFASIKNPTVKRLVQWRNNIGAHLGAKAVLGRANVLEEDPFTAADIEELLEGARNVVNQYSNLFSASTFSMRFVGQDDFQSLLAIIRRGLNQYEREIDEEVESAELQ